MIVKCQVEDCVGVAFGHDQCAQPQGHNLLIRDHAKGVSVLIQRADLGDFLAAIELVGAVL